MQTEEQAVTTNLWGIPETKQLDAPARKPQADIAKVDLVTFAYFGEYPVLKVNMTSSIGLPIEQGIFLTSELAENFSLDPSDYSDETKDTFRKSINNKKNDAVLDKYLRAAKEADDNKDFSKLGEAKNAEQLAAILTEILEGVEVLVTRKPDQKGFLRVNTVRCVSERFNPRYIGFVGRGGYHINYE